MCSYDHRRRTPNPSQHRPAPPFRPRTAHNRELSRIGDVTHHFPAGDSSAEVAVHQIGDRARLALLCGGRPPRPRLAGDQAELAHQGTDQLQPGVRAPAGQLPPDAPVPIGAVRIVECLGDQKLKFLPSFRRGAFRA